MNKAEIQRKAFAKKYVEMLSDEQKEKIAIALDRAVEKYIVNKEENLIKNDDYILQEIKSDNPAVVTWDAVYYVILNHLPATAEWINDHRAEEFRIKHK
jgi:hypothetical protein